MTSSLCTSKGLLNGWNKQSTAPKGLRGPPGGPPRGYRACDETHGASKGLQGAFKGGYLQGAFELAMEQAKHSSKAL